MVSSVYNIVSFASVQVRGRLIKCDEAEFALGLRWWGCASFGTSDMQDLANNRRDWTPYFLITHTIACELDRSDPLFRGRPSRLVCIEADHKAEPAGRLLDGSCEPPLRWPSTSKFD
jgi:hypothetical protein